MRLIDADALMKKALTESCFDSQTEDVFLDLVDSMPTVDAETTFEAERRASWVKAVVVTTDTSELCEYVCSNCLIVSDRESGYCPNCGKPMDGGGSDEG